MVNYFTCKLTVCGGVDSMNEFYAALNSNSAESPVEKFKMNKFVPIPEILFDEYLDNEFSPVSVLNKSIKGTNQVIILDARGRTRDEFYNLLSHIEEEYGTYSLEEWCENNWGCEEDLKVLDIMSMDERTYCVKYNCVWKPNSIFIKNLHELYPNLILTLEYVSEENLLSESIVFDKNKVTIETHTYKSICFKKLKDADKFLFVSNYEEADYWIDIMGADWIKSLENDGFTHENVENFHEILNYLRK